MTSRCFVSIDLPNSVKEYLGRLAHHDIYWIKWANPKNFHITLNFLGELKPERIEEARLVLKQVAALYQPFNIKLAEVEPSRDMLWLLPEDNETLAGLEEEQKEKRKGGRPGKREPPGYIPPSLLPRPKPGRNRRPVIE